LLFAQEHSPLQQREGRSASRPAFEALARAQDAIIARIANETVESLR
jgi:hypothetical protein